MSQTSLTATTATPLWPKPLSETKGGGPGEFRGVHGRLGAAEGGEAEARPIPAIRWAERSKRGPTWGQRRG